LSPFDLFCIVVSGVIFGGFLLGISTAAIIRYSRHEETGSANYPKALPDASLVVLTAAICLYGMWRAGVFGAPG
jgi:hypothetical protein